uniref:Secreted protein n=1 Tax=Steinernema glaseri TaxID=37863 RepID=A0A1I8ALM6_9BILA
MVSLSLYPLAARSAWTRSRRSQNGAKEEADEPLDRCLHIHRAHLGRRYSAHHLLLLRGHAVLLAMSAGGTT